MAGRGPQSFKKRQKEQERKDRQLAKIERKIQRKRESENPAPSGDGEAGVDVATGENVQNQEVESGPAHQA